MPAIIQLLRDNIVSKDRVLAGFRCFGSVPSMFPKGGSHIWGKGSAAPDFNHTGYMINFKPSQVEGSSTDSQPNETASCPELWDAPVGVEAVRKHSRKNYTSTEALNLMKELSPKYMGLVDSHYSFGLSRNFSDPKYLEDDRYWTNPLESPLPNAPHMKIYCMYGVGKTTERAYAYQENLATSSCRSSVPFTIDTTAYDLEKNLINGVFESDGDGTVPLVSNGFMCVKGWKDVLQSY